MEKTEFKRRLDYLNDKLLIKALIYDTLCLSFSPIESNLDVINWYKDTLKPIYWSFAETATLNLARLFDGDSKTISFVTLLKAVIADPSLLPHALPGQVKSIQQRINDNQQSIAWLKKIRNQRLAHLDVNPLPVDPMEDEAWEKLIEDIKWIFNQFSAAYDQCEHNWDLQVESSSEQAAEVFRILGDEMTRTLNV